jgi:hypothetical protein
MKMEAQILTISEIIDLNEHKKLILKILLILKGETNDIYNA